MHFGGSKFELLKRSFLISGASGLVGRSFISKISNEIDIEYKTLGRRALDTVQWSKLEIKDLSNIDVIYHFAGTTDSWLNRNKINTHQFVNVDLTKQLFSLFLQSDASLFVYLSTAKVMGEGRSNSYDITESPSPGTVYATSKRSAELIIEEMWLNFLLKNPRTNKKWVVLRPVMIFAPTDEGSLWSLFGWLNKGLPVLDSWSSTRRSMVSIETVVDFLLMLTSVQGLKPYYFVADTLPFELVDIFRLFSLEAGKNYRVVHLRNWQRKLLECVDQILFGHKIANVLGRMEMDFVVEVDPLVKICVQGKYDSKDRMLQLSQEFKRRLK